MLWLRYRMSAVPLTHATGLQKSKSNDNTRGFVKFIYEPIYNIIQAAMNDQKDKLFAMCEKVGIANKLSAADKELSAKPLMKRIMQVPHASSPC
jgi:elongation factor 2